jgi:hypothetical protein
VNIFQRWKQTTIANKVMVYCTAVIAICAVATAVFVYKQTTMAEDNIISENRPWMGGSVGVTDFEVGKKPNFSVNFLNSGHRPAEVEFTSARERAYPSFPKNPDSEWSYDNTPSTSIVVPGQGVMSPSQLPYPLSQQEMDLLINGTLTYFIFGKIEYRDARTNKRYFTHVCTRFIAKLKTAIDNGWRNCAEYNEVGSLPDK